MARKPEHQKPPLAQWATKSRRAAGLTAEQVLARVSISESYLYAIEGGSKKPSPHVLAELAAVYEVPVPTQEDLDEASMPAWGRRLEERLDAIGEMLLLIAPALGQDRAKMQAIWEELHLEERPGQLPGERRPTADARPQDA